MSFESRYRQGDLAEFFPLSPGDVTSALALPREVPKAALRQALGRYAAKLGAPEAVFEAVAKLEHPNSRAVLTGQQTGLLLGPTFTLSKAVTALKLARRLDSEAQPVVAVFWLASQDHDSAEIDHSYLLDLKETLIKVSLPLPEGVPSGRIGFEASWLASIEAQLAGFSAAAAHKADALEVLREAAAKAGSVADFFGALLYRLLGAEGLVVINPLEPDIAPLFKEVLARELEQPLISSGLINEAAERLSLQGYAPQLGRGAGATNLFIEENEGARRELLHFEGGTFRSKTRRYSRRELHDILEREPSRLTPAAGVRPVSQDALLPTVATVVGPGELRYFAQLREVYSFHGVAMPLVWPRATITLLEPPVARILRKYGLEVSDVQRHFEESAQRLLLDLHGHGEVVERCLGGLEQLTAELAEHLGAIDPTLRSTVGKTEARLRTGVERLKAKAAAALANRDEVTSKQLARLRLHLLPEGAPQERVISPFSPFMKFGVQPVMERVLSIEPEGEHVLEL